MYLYMVEGREGGGREHRRWSDVMAVVSDMRLYLASSTVCICHRSE